MKIEKKKSRIAFAKEVLSFVVMLPVFFVIFLAVIIFVFFKEVVKRR